MCKLYNCVYGCAIILHRLISSRRVLCVKALLICANFVVLFHSKLLEVELDIVYKWIIAILQMEAVDTGAS